MAVASLLAAADVDAALAACQGKTSRDKLILQLDKYCIINDI